MPASPLPPPDDLARITYKWERFRSLSNGILEVLWQPGASVALLIAIRYFDGGIIAKSLLSSANFAGFLLTPLSLSLFARMGRPITWNMSRLFALAAVSLALASAVNGLAPYVTLVVLAQVLLVQHLPMNTEMYGAHFTTGQRGHRIGTVFLIAGAVSTAANLGTGRLLDFNLEYFRGIMLLAAACAGISAACFARIPSRPLDPAHVGHPWRNLSLLKSDRLFAWMLASWMILGFGNLMTVPLRVEYMANPRFGVMPATRPSWWSPASRRWWRGC